MLTPDAMAITRADGNASLAAANLSDMGKSLRPREATQRLATAMRRGQDIRHLLEIQDRLLAMENRKHSLAATVAGMRNWHDFAVTVLSYSPEESFPPLTESDAAAWVTTFHNDGTAYNYVCCLRSIAAMDDLDKTWDGDMLAQQLQGVKKRRVDEAAGKIIRKQTMTEAQAQAYSVVKLAKAVGNLEFACFFVLGWAFWMRVQSECIGLGNGHS